MFCSDSNQSLTSSFLSGQVKFGVTHPDGQVEMNSEVIHETVVKFSKDPPGAQASRKIMNQQCHNPYSLIDSKLIVVGTI